MCVEEYRLGMLYNATTSGRSIRAVADAGASSEYNSSALLIHIVAPHIDKQNFFPVNVNNNAVGEVR